MLFIELRCEDCGSVQTTPRPEAAAVPGTVVALGPCTRCGGRLREDAPLRCPRCRSTEVDRGEVYLHYD